MLKYIGQSKVPVLDILELKEFTKALVEAKEKTDPVNKRKSLYHKTIVFFDWYLAYADNILKGKVYQEKQIAEIIFKNELKSPPESREFLLKSLFISVNYVKHLKSKINENNITGFDHTLSDLMIDLEWLIAQYEVHVNKSALSIHVGGWRRKNLSPFDIYGAARQMFHIEELGDINQLYLRDLKPVVMFQIRQTLEVYAKELIGLVDITDINGNPVKKFTQVGWEFIAEELKLTSPRIFFPYEVQVILTINSWANGFVHTTYLYNSYIQFFALNAIRALFIPGPKPIRIYDGQSSKKTFWADVTIRDYDSLKVHFELYLTARMPNIRVEWADPSQVGAYITSL